MKTHILSQWNLLTPQDRITVFEELYRTLPKNFTWLQTTKEAALNLTTAEADLFNTWWRKYRSTGEVS